MESDDLVDPGDAALQELLKCMAEHSSDPERRDRLLAHMMTVPSLADWPEDSLDALRETCHYGISLGRMSRELRQLTEMGEE